MFLSPGTLEYHKSNPEHPMRYVRNRANIHCIAHEVLEWFVCFQPSFHKLLNQFSPFFHLTIQKRPIFLTSRKSHGQIIPLIPLMLHVRV